ncbi:MAG: DnaJ family domain-containing protein [Candidatus Latescibacterota bacterium]
MNKPKLRTPDGKIQMRSVDDLLKEVAADDSWRNLPGKGKPIDLRSYFAPGEEYRVAGKILQENKVLPPHLQERKAAEAVQDAAKKLRENAQHQIPPLRTALLQKIETLISLFPDQTTCQTWLNLDNWPSDYPKPPPTACDQKQLFEAAQYLTQEIPRYNARIRNLIYRYMDHLKRAQENINNYHKRQLLNTTLSPHYNYLAPIDLAHKEQEIKELFPPLIEFPQDLLSRLKKWQRKTQPTFWRRLMGLKT